MCSDVFLCFCPGGAREAKNTNSRFRGTWPSRQERPEVSKPAHRRVSVAHIIALIDPIQHP